MNNELLLLSGCDIPFIEAQITVHAPRMKEIGLIGEEAFWSGVQFLNFSKNLLSGQDKIDLSEVPDFELFMNIMQGNEMREHKNNAVSVLTLLFPSYQIKFSDSEILLLGPNGMARINNTNFDIFKDIVISLFDLNDVTSSKDDYNPVDDRANVIAEKLRKAKEKRDAQKKTETENVSHISILSRYISILAVGEHKDINAFMDYTVFQLKDEFKRFQMKQAFDTYMSARMAGASDLEEVDNWMDNIHP